MHKYITIFCIVDDFCKIYQYWIKYKLLKSNKQRERSGKLQLSALISIMIFYHFSEYKHLKVFYKNVITNGNLFYNSPCYDRFIAIIPSLFLPLMIMQHYLSGKRTGIYFADSTHFAVCKNIRIGSHKTFNGLAVRGHNSMDYFFGFKLHMIVNNKGEIIAVKITKGNRDDRKPFEELVESSKLKGKAYADKGYLSKEMFNRLYSKGLHLITSIRKDMKNYLMPLLDKMTLRKRFIIETIFGYIKENFNLRPNKHRSPVNFFASLFAALIAYQLTTNKPSIS